MSGFAGTRAIVTGAASGIGRVLVEGLLQRGATVLACDVDVEGLRTLVDEDTSGRLSTERLDVTDAAAVAAAVEGFAAAGNLDLIVNNAGIAIGGELLDLELGDWTRVLDINLRGVIHGVHAAYPVMVRQGKGQIVNMASISGLAPYPLVLPYTTSKHAVVGLTLALRAEAAAHGVRVNVVCPGRVRTAIWERPTVKGSWNLDWMNRLPSMSVERCAQKVLKGIGRNRPVIVVTAEARVLSLLHRFSPRLSVWLHSKLAARARTMGRAAG